MKKNTLIINCWAGPGSGKSTISAGLFSQLKMHHVDCELVREWSKEKVWETNNTALSDQFYISACQHYAQHIISGQVDAIITDSPILLGLFYYKEENQIIREAFTTFLVETFKQQNNLNIFINRKKKYNPNGRNQTEEEARQIDIKIKEFLDQNNIKYIEIDGTPEAAVNLYSIVSPHLPKF